MEADTLESVGTRQAGMRPQTGALPLGPRLRRALPQAPLPTAGTDRPSTNWPKRWLARLRSELGTVALPEVLVAAPVMIATLGAVLSFNLVSVNELDRVESRVHAGSSKTLPNNQRVALAKMTRDLRQATSVISTYSGSDDPGIHFEAMLKPPGGGAARKRQVWYHCYGENASPDFDERCWRFEGPSLEDGGGFETMTAVVENVVNADVFAIDPATKPDLADPAGPEIFNDTPRQVTVKLAVAVKHELCPDDPGTGCRNPNPTNPIVLQAGVELPNTEARAAGSEDYCDYATDEDELCN